METLHCLSCGLDYPVDELPQTLQYMFKTNGIPDPEQVFIELLDEKVDLLLEGTENDQT